MGWNKPSGEVSLPPKKPSAMRGVVAGVACVGIVVVVAFFVLSGKDVKPKVKVEKTAGLIKEAKPAAAPTNAVKSVATTEKKWNTPNGKRPAKAGDLASEVYNDGTFKYTNSIGKLLLKAPKKSAFKTAAESYLAWMFKTEMGDAPPPLFRISEADKKRLAEILDSDDPAKEGDSAAVAAGKDMLQVMKKELKRYVEEGGKPDDFVQYYHGLLKEANVAWCECRKMAYRAVREEDPEVAKSLIDQMNESLAAKGIKKVVVSQKAWETAKSRREAE